MRNDLITQMVPMLDQIIIQLYLISNEDAKLKDCCVALENYKNTHINTSLDKYTQAYERFSTRLIEYVSEYYNAVDDLAVPKKNIADQRVASNTLKPRSLVNTNSKYDINDLIKTFNEYCEGDYKYNLYCSKPKKIKEKAWNVYKNLSNYISHENVYDISIVLVYEIDVFINGVSICALKNIKNSGLVSLVTKTKTLLSRLNHMNLDFKPGEEEIDYCECGNLMQILFNSSEMVCNNCGFIYELKGTVFDDSQFYSQEGTRYKHAGYEPSKHCKCWLERIQAKESNNPITKDHIEKIEKCIARDGRINRRQITVEQIREYLKLCKLSELNEHVALIKRIITGISPPQLTHTETQEITNSFSKAVKAYNLIRPTNKSNMLFYPFLLLKLIEIHVENFQKRKDLISYIHMQGSSTLRQNDTIWYKICQIVDDLEYKPTDRYAYM